MTNVFHMEPSEFERISEILRVLAHPVRLRIVHQLIKKKSLNVSELQRYLSMPQSTVSQHLSKLKTHKVVAYGVTISKKENCTFSHNLDTN
ncbi:helix-turn-helix transcriptional regulator [Bacillus thuringiensis]|uniref:ArsR/SmtB family transcription factor n=1 Tax=Bacillus thuringiensis TaxID=1428 RepID=UPI00125F47D7|nr:metalloregulator ArsR/SmtB family transcription factor [Bacillus thuringiensis]KAB5623363.1 helix-turn-helix transcriptional regulator [Bacillus thuringiensis]HDR5272627.1 helix-turn-helix transcriptional regulator [Bacillus thuringiensis]